MSLLGALVVAISGLVAYIFALLQKNDKLKNEVSSVKAGAEVKGIVEGSKEFENEIKIAVDNYNTVSGAHRSSSSKSGDSTKSDPTLWGRG